MKSRLVVIAGMLAALAAPAARAQEAAPTLQEDPRAAKFRDVEHGLFVGFEVGGLRLLDTPTADTAKHAYAGTGGGAANGVQIGLHVGFDFGKWVAVSAFALGANEQASSKDYGAFSLYAGGLDVRVSPVSFKDRNGWDRLFVYGHVRYGQGLTRPKGLLGDAEAVLAGGPGIEYFTRLRHFSVGLAADYVRVMKAGVSGVAVYPTVRYTF